MLGKKGGKIYKRGSFEGCIVKYSISSPIQREKNKKYILYI